MSRIFTLLLLFAPCASFSQSASQNTRGIVTDKQTNISLPGWC